VPPATAVRLTLPSQTRSPAAILNDQRGAEQVRASHANQPARKTTIMADLPYRYVIGLEVHVQLLTRTKLFCGCSTAFGLPPNSATCPVCLGLPGVLPVLNRRAFDLALRAAVALRCRISRFTKWDRKNYYYPDLPKNYQISQYDLPLGHDGALELATPSGPKKVGIIRVHLEEDAGKMLHDEAGTAGDSLVDLNRTGTPLAEIVGQPELSSPEEAKQYLEEMALLMREIGVSDCQMQEGSLRCDANVNIHIPQPGGGHVATPIVEIKNLNSFRFLERAVRHEAQRQYEQWHKDPGYVMGRVSKETAGWDEARGVTTFQRRKEEAADYRYFPEPDLVPVVVDDAWLARVEAELGELPAAARARLPRQYGLSDYDVGVLLAMGRATVGYFEETAKACGDGKAACNWVTNQVQGTLKETGGDLASFPMPAARLGELIAKQKEMGLPRQKAVEVYERMLADGTSAAEAVAALGIRVVDSTAVVEIVRRALAANPKAVADYKGGKAAAANALKGAVMRETKGSVRPDVVEQVLKEELDRA
jgi:aspartyl-tRNA(Asn)/glutamyl-tRNA(Gln) amidotransferase subunit B